METLHQLTAFSASISVSLHATKITLRSPVARVVTNKEKDVLHIIHILLKHLYFSALKLILNLKFPFTLQMAFCHVLCLGK